MPDLTQEFGKSRVSLLLKPCGHIGGDLVGMFSPGPNRLGFYSIDVSGHGITSAMMTARLGGYLSSKHFDQNVAMEKRFNKFYALLPPEEVAAPAEFPIGGGRGDRRVFYHGLCHRLICATGISGWFRPGIRIR